MEHILKFILRFAATTTFYSKLLMTLPVDGTANGIALVLSDPCNLMLNGSPSIKRISVFYKMLPLI